MSSTATRAATSNWYAGGERVHPLAEGVESVLLALRVDERVMEIVDPRAGEPTQLGLEREHVGLGRTVGRAHDDVEPRHDRFGHQCGVVDIRATERATGGPP